jgi:hypothetical protein
MSDLWIVMICAPSEGRYPDSFWIVEGLAKERRELLIRLMEGNGRPTSIGHWRAYVVKGRIEDARLENENEVAR